MNNQLIIDRPELISEIYRRVITTDPKIYFERAYMVEWFSHYKRTNSLFSEIIFPQPDKTICSCGCGQKLSGKRRRWVSDECLRFSRQIMGILTGDSDVIRYIVKELYGYKCFNCGDTEQDIWRKYQEKITGYEKESILNMDLDHIIPVHKGGGCTWIDNYQLLCRFCHKQKTKNDIKK